MLRRRKKSTKDTNKNTREKWTKQRNYSVQSVKQTFFTELFFQFQFYHDTVNSRIANFDVIILLIGSNRLVLWIE